MRSRWIEILTAVLALALICGFVVWHLHPEDIPSFDVSNYKLRISWHGGEDMPKLGDISTKEKALAAAEELFAVEADRYGILRKPFNIQYDDNADVWLISTISQYRHKISLLAERNTGIVLALWIDRP